MRRWWWIGLGPLVVAAGCREVVVLTPEQQAQEVYSAIDIPGGQSRPGPPPAANEGDEFIQIRHLAAPALLQPGQGFVVHVQTDVEDPERISGAALAVVGAPDHIYVSELPPVRGVEQATGELWWSIDLPAEFASSAQGLTEDSFEFQLGLIDENDNAGNYFTWTVWAGEQGPTCPDDAACGTQQCGVDPVCGLPCGDFAGACEGTAICDFYGICVVPAGTQPVECPDACTQAGIACGPHPQLEGCECPSTCLEGELCNSLNECAPVPTCQGRQDCQPNEDCMAGVCNPISCGPTLPCPDGTFCNGSVCTLGCEAGLCPPGSNCVGMVCEPLACSDGEAQCPIGSFCDLGSQSCRPHGCDLADPELSCPGENVCRVVADLTLDDGPGVMPASCQAPGVVPLGGICVSEPTDGSHNCDADGVCWNPTTTGESVCLERCTGPEMNTCDVGVCNPVVPLLIHACMQTCDPLDAGSCSAFSNHVCAPTSHANQDVPLPGFPLEGGSFVCHPAPEMVAIPARGTCQESEECEHGFACAQTEGGICDEEDMNRCCVPWCDESTACAAIESAVGGTVTCMPVPDAPDGPFGACTERVGP